LLQLQLPLWASCEINCGPRRKDLHFSQLRGEFMKHLNPLLTLLFVAAIAVSSAVADSPCSDSEDAPVGFDNTACKSTIPFGAGVTPVPLVDGSTTTLYGTTSEIVSVYGNFGVTDERSSGSDAGAAHYSQGVTLANQIAPLCSDGTVGGPNGCTDGKPKKIVFHFLGF